VAQIHTFNSHGTNIIHLILGLNKRDVHRENQEISKGYQMKAVHLTSKRRKKNHGEKSLKKNHLTIAYMAAMLCYALLSCIVKIELIKVVFTNRVWCC